VSNQVEHLSSNAQVAAKYLAALAENKIEVPMLPDVANQVLALSNDPDSDAAQLARLIQSDQALAGHVMRIANAAAYTPNASIVSLQQAIARLGMALITEIALAASLNSKLFKAETFQNRIDQIWEHALATALWGKEVARISKKNVEAAFLCGLLHSIGRPVVLQTLHEYLSGQAKSVSLDEALILEELNHGRYAQVIVRKWKMPDIVQAAVSHYHDFANAGAYIDAARVTYAASLLAQEMLKNQAIPDSVIENEVFSQLNLYRDELELLVEQTDKVHNGLEALRS